MLDLGFPLREAPLQGRDRDIASGATIPLADLHFALDVRCLHLVESVAAQGHMVRLDWSRLLNVHIGGHLLRHDKDLVAVRVARIRRHVLMVLVDRVVTRLRDSRILVLVPGRGHIAGMLLVVLLDAAEL